MPFALADLAARYHRAQIATAANVRLDVVDAALGDLPDGLTPEQRTDLLAEAEAMKSFVAVAIDDARGEVAGAVAIRYDWATVQGDATVMRLVADRAMALMHGEVVPEELRDRMKSAHVLLGALRKGGRSLADADGNPRPTRDRGAASAPEPTMGGPNGLLQRY